MLKEYFQIQTQIKELESELRGMREKLILKGTHSERDFICEVGFQARRNISLVEIEKSKPKLFLKLEQEGMIHETTSHIVKVIPKKVA